MAPLALVPNLATRWRHLHWFQNWPPGCLTCIATLPLNAFLALAVGIDLVTSSARVPSVKSQKCLSLTERHLDPTIGPQVYLGPIKSAVVETNWLLLVAAVSWWGEFFVASVEHQSSRKSSAGKVGVAKCLLRRSDQVPEI